MKEIKNKINSKGLKQCFIANQIGISRQLLNMYLNEKANIPEHTYQKIKSLLA